VRERSIPKRKRKRGYLISLSLHGKRRLALRQVGLLGQVNFVGFYSERRPNGEEARNNPSGTTGSSSMLVGQAACLPEREAGQRPALPGDVGLEKTK
jgi:hypothetical protein